MFCTNCGKEISDDAKVCKYCGATYYNLQKDNKIIIEQTVPAEPAGNNITNSDNSQNNSTVKKRSNKAALVIAGCLTRVFDTLI